MNISLYDALVPSWLQILEATSNLMHKADAHCTAQNLNASDLINARLAPDMHPLGYQVKAIALHSIGAIEAARQGIFAPERSPWPDSLMGLRDFVASAIDKLSVLDPAEINAWCGRDLRFEVGAYKLDYLTEDFLLSFSQPNFFFHATTAYGILRSQGLAIGKLDYLGVLRHKP